MATLILGAVGSAIGGAIGGSVFGVTAATIGGAVGSALGSVADSMLVAALMPSQTQTGARLSDLRVTSATEGAVIPRVHGRIRVGGNLIWATDFKEQVHKERVGGKGGGGQKVKTYSYYASFAVAICEGPIAGVTRMWADGKPFWWEDGVRIYLGTEDQEPDPYMVAITGDAPAYRGVAYIVFEDLPLERFGNRLPQLSFEVVRPADDAASAEQLIRAVTMIPGSGEYVYGVTPVTRGSGGAVISENQHASSAVTDFLRSLDDLEVAAPNCESVTLVVGWFGNDLRCGSCLIKPGVEDVAKEATETWAVDGVARAAALQVSESGGLPAFGGTPSDHVVVAAIQELKARGFRVTFCPLVLMDIPSGNTLPDPYSNGAAGVGQGAYPWRARITCSPAAGYTGTVDKTATAGTQVSSFFGAAAVGNFSVVGEAVSWTGGTDWGYRRMVLHYALLCAAAGGVDAFLVGSELKGLTQVRSAAGTYPAVTALATLAGDVRGIVGAGTKISYAAEYTEYFGHAPADGSGDYYFHLDPLWANSNVDFIGIDNFAPLADWREGDDHLDAQSWSSIYDPTYLLANVEGGEGYFWSYASGADRDVQARTTIADAAYGKPWMFRPKDIRNWWLNQHYNRPAGVQSGSPTGWVPQSKPIRFTAAGCAAVDKGANTPGALYDPRSSASAVPFYSRGTPDDLIQRRVIEALYVYWNEPTRNPASGVYSGRMIDTAELAIWAWDARPYPAFPARADVWGDAASWRLGHWLNGRLGAGSLSAVVREICLRSGIPPEYIDVTQLQGELTGYALNGIESARGSIEPLRRLFGFDAVESEGIIRFVSRSGAAVATIAADDMVADAEAGDVIALTRAQETELARARKWRVLDADADYGGLTVEARRGTVDTSRITAESFDVAVPGHVADRGVRRALLEEWVGRESAALRLPPSRLAIDATDVLAIEHDGRTITMTVAEVSDGTVRTVKARRAEAGVYNMPVSIDRPVITTPPVIRGPALARILALPQLTEDQDPRAAYGAVYADPWWGSAEFQWSPAADTWIDAGTQSVPATAGVLVDPLPAGPLHRWDMGNSILVDMPTAALSSLTDTALLAGGNALAIESAPGLWEIVQFGTATLVSAGRWRLSRLLRGQFCTDDAMGAPAPAGSQVVLLDDGIIGLVLQVTEIGSDIGWRVVPFDAGTGDAAITPITFDHTGRGLRPWTPAQLRGYRQTDASWSLSWIRRSRNPTADNWALIEVPQDETAEVYRLEILSGLTVVRAVDLTDLTAWSYSAANQTADFGAPVTSLTWRVAQYGQLGLGPWSTTTST